MEYFNFFARKASTRDAIIDVYLRDSYVIDLTVKLIT